MIVHDIPEGVPAMKLERYLRRAWPLLPGRVLRVLDKRKDVRVNDVKSDGSALVRGGDRLNIYAEDTWFSMPPDILWTDDRLIVAVKPQGLPVDVDQDGVGADTLLTRLQRRWPSARLCHRLDAATGGIVLAAADDEVYEQAFEAFKNHGVQKQYHALALGHFEQTKGTLRAWLQKDACRAEVRILHQPRGNAKPIETRYNVGEEAAPGVTHVWLEPVTGRTHQLRAHMADFGHPFLGDDKYGDRAANRQFARLPLCLWHERLIVPKDSPLIDYRGRAFECSAPDWMGMGKEDRLSL